MASVIISGDTSGTVTLSAPTVAGSTTQTLVAATGTLAPIVNGTAVTATTVFPLDFTSIPSWAKKITVMFAGASPSLADWLVINLGTSGGIVATGYLGSAFITTTSGITAMSNSTAINIYNNSNSGADIFHGSVVLSLLNPATNTWTAMGLVSKSNNLVMSYVTGSISLASALTQVRVTTSGGTGSLDAGSINIMYE